MNFITSKNNAIFLAKGFALLSFLNLLFTTKNIGKK